jgi:hypothetical protein
MNARALFLLPLLALACWPCPAEQGGSPTPAGTAAAAQSLAVPEGLEATLFAAEPLLSSPSDIDVDARGSVWVCEFHDDDGDLKADQRETLFSKIGTPQHDHSVHAFVVGPDGRWYFNFGNTGKAVPDKDGNPVTDRWFRPSDVCVAPDGSLIVADWYDPGVGGHGMGDTEKGRIYRIAPKGQAWRVPSVELKTVAGAIAALASANHCTRAMALERLGREPAAAGPALAEAFESAREPWLKARLAWAAGMLPGQSEAWIKRLAADKDENLRVVALRMCRLTKGDVLALVETFTADPAASVRREATIALKGLRGERADRAWAALAARHTAGDRWELEALGIGADGPSGLAGENQRDGRLAAWLQLIGGNWKTPAGREVVYRSRAAISPQLICEAIGDASVGTSESLAMIRALDFQDRQRVAEAVRLLVVSFAAPDEKFRVILPELVTRLDAAQGQG